MHEDNFVILAIQNIRNWSNCNKNEDCYCISNFPTVIKMILPTTSKNVTTNINVISDGMTFYCIIYVFAEWGHQAPVTAFYNRENNIRSQKNTFYDAAR